MAIRRWRHRSLEADAAEVEGFLADILLCLPVLGYGFFEPVPSPPPATLELFLNARGVEARGYESATGFVVRSGSQAAKSETKSIQHFLTDLRQSLLEQGVLTDKGLTYELTQDYAFNSPSTASGVLLSRASNGRTEWKTIDGRTLKSIQDAEVGE